MGKKHLSLIVSLTWFVFLLGVTEALSALNTSPPSSPVKLIFIHHSCGENWLADDNGGLGIALRDNNYFVSDTYYGWGPDSIGDNTDIGHWWNWFRGPNSSTYLDALYTESEQCQWWNCFSRLATDPGGENQIIMFKSCYPNSYLGGNPNAAATSGINPLRGEDYSSEHMTVANAKGIYNDLLVYFATRPCRLFIAVTAPPQADFDTDATHAANARAFNDWLVNDWLDSYPYDNVAVFDFYNVLTSNGGDVDTNDLGEETGNHHRWWNGAIQHLQTVNSNVSAYPSGDSHPSAAGNQKATDEFIDLLNIWYNCWNGTGDCPGAGGGPAFNLIGITTDLAGAPAVGSPVEITFTPSVATALYAKWYERIGFQPPESLGSWLPPTSWSLNSYTYSWSATEENRYIVLAWVSETDDATSNKHQIGLTVETQGFSTNPQITSFTTDATYPHPSGTAINLSATAIGSGGQIYFRYFFNAGAGWLAAGPWSTSGDLSLTLGQAGVVTIVVNASYDQNVASNSLSQAGMTCTLGN